jgi:excisionase family DNA binding protein
VTTEFKPLTKEDVADVLGVSLRTVDNWVNDGTLIAPRKIGNRVYWHPRTFYTWLDQALSAPTAGEETATSDTAAGGQPPSATTAPHRTKAAASNRSESDAIRARDRAKLEALLT